MECFVFEDVDCPNLCLICVNPKSQTTNWWMVSSFNVSIEDWLGWEEWINESKCESLSIIICIWHSWLDMHSQHSHSTGCRMNDTSDETWIQLQNGRHWYEEDWHVFARSSQLLDNVDPHLDRAGGSNWVKWNRAHWLKGHKGIKRQNMGQK